MEIILHVYDKTTGQELSEADINEPNVRVFSYSVDRILTEDDFIINKLPDGMKVFDTTMATRKGKTLKQDFIDRIASIKQRAQSEKPCSAAYCHWCKDCYNKVCDNVGRKADKIA